MAKHLDLDEQEQLDQIKHFWAQYGNMISWVLIVVFGSIAAWNGWNYWQRNQAVKASALYDEIERAALSKDVARTERALADMKDGYGGTTFAAQGALLAGKTLYEASQAEAARSALSWVAEKAGDDAYKAIARLRLAGLDLDAKDFGQALKRLEAPVPAAFEPLVADRRGDIYLAQGLTDQARGQYEKAFAGLGDRIEYRRLVEVKLASLGAPIPATPASLEVTR